MQRKALVASVGMAVMVMVSWFLSPHTNTGASAGRLAMSAPVSRAQVIAQATRPAQAATRIASQAIATLTPTPVAISQPQPARAALAAVAVAAEPLIKQAPKASPAPTPTALSPEPVTAGAAASLAVNGVAFDKFVLLSDAARQRVREIYAQGQAQGRDPHAFLKVGDSTMAYPPLLEAFGSSDYRLGDYGYLQRTIDYYDPSFRRVSAAVKKGMHTWTEFDPDWVASDRCVKNEAPLACELRLSNASVAVIRLGANDAHVPDTYNEQLRRILDYLIGHGVVPILGTKPDRIEGAQNTINNLVYQVADEYHLPVWDYDTVVSTIPGKGLLSDGIHYQASALRDFASPATFRVADSIEDLTALMALDAVRQTLTAPQ